MASLLDLAQARLQGLLDIPTRAARALVNPTAFSGLLGAPTLPQQQGMAEAAYGLPARQNMSVLDPNQAAYLQGYQQGEPLAYLGMATPFAAPAAVAGAKAVAPKAGMALENYMASQGLIQPLTAFHGTPHTIRGKFDISKVGTGEGAQSYGYGMYFAENPKVAEEYRKQLSNFDEPFIKFGKNKITGSEMSDVDLEALKYLEIGRSQAGKFPHNTVYYAKQAAKDNPEVVKKLEEFGSDVKFGYEKNTGNLYKVDIPDEYIPNMLNWDEPFSKQTKSVQEAIKQIEPKIKMINPDIDVEKMNGQQIYRAYQQYRGNNPDFASEGLNELGIKGIKYLDQGSRNPGFSSLTPAQLDSRIDGIKESLDAGLGNKEVLERQLKSLQTERDSYKNLTSNFVVFDPTDVKILEKNSQKVEGLLD